MRSRPIGFLFVTDIVFWLSDITSLSSDALGAQSQSFIFWIGPRNGAIANDIMNPKPGERGLLLRWIEATEIHPEPRDEDATLAEVEKLS